MKLVIELTNGKTDVYEDCELVMEMLSGKNAHILETMFNHKVPNYHFED